MQSYPDDGGATDAPDASTAAEGIAPAPEPVSHFGPAYAQRNGSGHAAPYDQAPARIETRADAGDRDTVYGALDLGTNNCRLLLARPSRRGFRVVDAFSAIWARAWGKRGNCRLPP